MGAKKQMPWSRFSLHYSGKAIKSYNLVIWITLYSFNWGTFYIKMIKIVYSITSVTNLINFHVSHVIIYSVQDIQSKSFFWQIFSGLALFKDIQCNSKLVNIYSKFWYIYFVVLSPQSVKIWCFLYTYISQ